MSRTPLIGVLGGMGPLATVDFLHKVVASTPATCDQDHVPLLVWNVPAWSPTTELVTVEGAVQGLIPGAWVPDSLWRFIGAALAFALLHLLAGLALEKRHGLAWVFRLYQEPGRLWKRYLVTNTQFILRCTRQWIRQRLGFRTSTHPAKNIS